ncbi:hypothetical protein M501DRAFT_987100 [Patellaria atrata CBS 101060]|uniref:Uncharacterized protein n=1 Tax=Patellaria atrata CBS 101060 TaxID=1346257 RepID=A0A9P4VP19_9PEZI|nr:hypothetical protein M501DRAFT_987100 [Patellaria atrata CBS 101060]
MVNSLLLLASVAPFINLASAHSVKADIAYFANADCVSAIEVDAETRQEGHCHRAKHDFNAFQARFHKGNEPKHGQKCYIKVWSSSNCEGGVSFQGPELSKESGACQPTNLKVPGTGRGVSAVSFMVTCPKTLSTTFRTVVTEGTSVYPTTEVITSVSTQDFVAVRSFAPSDVDYSDIDMVARSATATKASMSVSAASAKPAGPTSAHGNMDDYTSSDDDTDSDDEQLPQWVVDILENENGGNGN